MRKLDRDRMNQADPRRVGNAAFALIDVNQHRPPEEQILALMAAFKLVAEHLNVPAQDVATAAGNIMTYASTRRPEFLAIAQYLDREM